MKIMLEIFLFIFSFGILLTNIHMLFSLRNIMKYAKNSSSIPADERYYELKLRMQILIVTIILAGSAITFIGWNTQENIIKTVREEILNEVSNDVGKVKMSAKQIEDKINSFDVFIVDQTGKIQNLVSNSKNLQLSYFQLDELVKSKIQNLKTLLNVYIVTGIKLNLDSKPLKLFFKDLKPINAQNLPVFKNAPIISIQTDNGLGVDVNEINKDYLIIAPNHGLYNSDAPVNGNVTIWFIKET